MDYVMYFILIVFYSSNAYAAATFSSPTVDVSIQEKIEVDPENRRRMIITEADAINWYREQSRDDNKNGTAQRVLSEIIREGWGGVEVDEKEADRLLEQAAINGDIESQFKMAEKVLPDHYRRLGLLNKESFYWYKKAAEANHPKALYVCGRQMILMGEDTSGINFIYKSARLGNIEAINWRNNFECRSLSH